MFRTDKVRVETRDSKAISLKYQPCRSLFFSLQIHFQTKLLPLSNKSNNVPGTEKAYYERKQEMKLKQEGKKL